MSSRNLGRAFLFTSLCALATAIGCSDDSTSDDDVDDAGNGSSGHVDASTTRPDASGSSSSGGGSSSGGSSSGGSSSSSSGSVDLDAGDDAQADAGEDAETDAGPAFDLYDPSVVREFSIDLDAAAIAILSDENPDNEKKWAKGTFHFGDETYENVGVRRKGSSTFRAYPQKMSLKIRFDKNVDGQRFHGLTDLTLNNMISDTTQLVERLSYLVFRQLGLPAQRANAAHVILNTPNGVEDFGLYADIETPDQDLVANVYGAQGNTLYEAATGDWSGATGPLEDTFAPEGDVDTQADLAPFFAAMNAAQPATLLADVGAVLDTAKWLRYCAGEAAVGHVDGYAYGYVGSHNYYLAGDANGTFTLLPWSTDLTFSNNIVDPPNASTPGRANYDQTGTTLLQRCKAAPTCWASYTTEVASVLTAFEGMNLAGLAAQWRAQIDPYVNAATFDSVKRLGQRGVANSGQSHASYVGAWQGENDNLITWIGARPGMVRGQMGIPQP